MRGSLIILSLFIVGVLLGQNFEELAPLATNDASRYLLYALMLTVGIGIGCNRASLEALRRESKLSILLPLGTIIGSLIGAIAIFPLLTGIKLSDTMAIASGFGYYSLSSILLTECRGAEIGTIALMANIIREIVTIVLAPLIVRGFGKMSLVSSAGATSIDTTLPFITRFSGEEYVVIAIFHGLVLEIAVPILVTFFAGL